MVISSSGCNVVPIEIAQSFQEMGIKVVALVSLNHMEGSASKKTDGSKLSDFADLLLDTGAPLGDASVNVPGLDTPVAPISTVGGVLVINCLKAEIARSIWGNEKYYQVLLLYDNQYNKAMNLFSRLQELLQVSGSRNIVEIDN